MIRISSNNAGCSEPTTRVVQNGYAGNSEHQRENAIRLVHVCLGTLMKAGLPRPASMESSVALSAVQDALFTGVQGQPLY